MDVKYKKGKDEISLGTFSSQAELTDKKAEGDTERPQWGSKTEFMLACVGYAVGLGNVWRFPWLAQQNGGGAFLIPYFIMLLLEGIPLFYMELSIGQRFRLGPIHVWKKVSPWAVGIGYGQCIASFLSSTFYNVVIAWCFYYLFISFQAPLPYHSCPDKIFDAATNTTDMTEFLKCEKIGSTQYYWYNEALHLSDTIDDASGFAWKITMCLLLAWILVALCMWKGIQTTGKVVYFTATFPYVVLLVFIIQGLMLEGHADGLKFFFVPEWSKLKDPNVWMSAAAQIFFSLSLSFGGLIAYASYNDVKNNTLKDALIISFTNCGTSIFAGIAIFSILGYRANKKSTFCKEQLGILKNETGPANCSVEHFLKTGTGGSGLAFVAFTEAINHLPVPTFFSIIFFLMLITLGLGSMFGSLEGLVTSLRDMPFFQKVRKEFIIVMVAFPGFLAGLAFTLYSGEYLVQLFNKFSVDVPILMVAFFELILISWIYGLDKFGDDIEFMTGRRPPLFFVVMWKVLSPLGLVLMLGLSFYDMFTQKPVYDAWNSVTANTAKLPYPDWALGIGITVFVTSFLFVPGGALIHWWRTRKNGYSVE